MPAEVVRDKNEQELIRKVKALVSTRYGGNYQLAFQHYDGNHDGRINRDELVRLLEDAGVGNRFTRGAWANGIIMKLDRSGDSSISWQEFDWVARFAG